MKHINLKKLCGTLLLGITLSLSLTGIQAQAAYQGTHFGLDLNMHESSKCEISNGWSNGNMFQTCTWRSSNVGFSNNRMQLSITNDPQHQTPYAGGEYRTKDTFGYGNFQVQMKPIKNDGVVSSFFTYTGPTDGTKWDEIDIEFLGKNTNQVQFNYYSDGVGNHEYLYNLGFDASQSFHTYGFIWEPNKITWYVDKKPVHTATNNIPTTPGKIMMNVWPGYGVDSWLNAFNGHVPLTAEYDWASYDSLTQTSSTPTPTPAPGGSISDGTYVFQSKYDQKAIDVERYSKDNGANVLQWDYKGSDNQKWNIKDRGNGYYSILNAYSGKALEVAGYSHDNAANVQQWDYYGGDSQLWKIQKVNDAYILINKGSGKALDIAAWSKDNGGNIQQWDAEYNDKQLWYLHRM